MKKNTFALKGPKGVTLIELTVVIAIILVLISVLFVGANFYRTNANRAACIINITNLHKAARSVENITNTVVAATNQFIGAGLPVAVAPTCPQDGNAYIMGAGVTTANYVGGQNAGPPVVGLPALVTCTTFDGNANNRHRPNDTTGW